MKWNARINLTAVRDPEEMITRHFGESFFCANHVFSAYEVESMIDLGSGAGFPGIPFALWSPETQVTLIEANQKKATFLREIIFALELKSVKVFAGRADKFSEQANLVTMRAVESFEESLWAAIKLVEKGGKIGLMIGSSQIETARNLSNFVKWDDSVMIPGSQSRILAVGTKVVKSEK
jgi:16S rRNA (guanine527-N7)-methyltransferase